MHRRWANLQVNEPVDVYPWDPTKEKDVATSFLFKLTLEIDFVLKNRQVAETFDTDVMAEQFKTVRKSLSGGKKEDEGVSPHLAPFFSIPIPSSLILLPTSDHRPT